MKECIEEWWRIGRKIQPQMRNTQISPSFLTWFPRDPKVLQALQASKKCPRGVPNRVFKSTSKCPKFQLLYHVIKIRSKRVAEWSLSRGTPRARPWAPFGRRWHLERAHGRYLCAGGAQSAHMGARRAPIALLQSSCFFCSLFSSSWFFLPPILEHLFLHKIERGLMSFLHSQMYNSTPNFTKVCFFMYCSFHLKLCIFSTYISSKIMYNPR